MAAPGQQAVQMANVVPRDLPAHIKILRASWGAQGLLLGALAKVLGKKQPLRSPVLPTRVPGDTKFSTPPAEIEAKLKRLHENKKQWAATPFAERARLARECAKRASKAGARVAMLSAQYKGTYEGGLGEELLLWLNAVTCLRETGDSLAALASGRPLEPNAVRVVAAAAPGAPPQAVADVFPATAFEHILFNGFRGELWIEPGKPVRAADAVRSRLGGAGGLTVILAAGNVSALSVTDIAAHCLALGEACAVKLNPVNEYLGPTLEEVCAPLVDCGALAFVYGGGEAGAALLKSPLVGALHLTGSDKTLDAIVWGGRPKVGEPPFALPVTAELGCVTPVVVVPGRAEWTDRDIRGKAAQVAWMVANNSSCNCIASKVLVLSEAWPQRAAFLAALRAAVGRLSPRACYYPGASEKYQEFRRAYPDAQVIGAEPAPDSGCVPFLLAEVDPSATPPDEHAFTCEAWSPVLAVASLPGPPDPSAFLPAAARFCNERLWGTLSASVFCHPADMAADPPAFDRFLADMRYGSVGVNTLSALNFSINKLPWGAYPGHTLADIQSGVGQIHNVTFVEDVQKGVLYGPWDPPVCFTDPDLRNTEDMGRKMLDFFAEPSVARLAVVAAAAVQN